jgi:hypothetical protein
MLLKDNGQQVRPNFPSTNFRADNQFQYAKITVPMVMRGVVSRPNSDVLPFGTDHTQISPTNMRDQEHSDGEKMALLAFLIHMVCRTLHLHSGTEKS